jgi:hypothetical protein
MIRQNWLHHFGGRIEGRLDARWNYLITQGNCIHSFVFIDIHIGAFIVLDRT